VTRTRTGRAALVARREEEIAVNSTGWPARYEIRVDSVLGDQWADWFGGLQFSRDGSQTVIVGLIPDQPALHGLLTKIRDLGLCLISVRRLDASDAAGQAQE
jgi:hypothetical protein